MRPLGVNALDVARGQRQRQARGLAATSIADARELRIDLGARRRDAFGRRGTRRRLQRERHGREAAGHELLDRDLRDAVVGAIDAGRRRDEHVDVRVERRRRRVHGAHALLERNVGRLRGE